MLDQELKEQLKTVFAKLENPVSLSVYTSKHSDQDDLLKMLEDLSSVSDKIKIERLTEVRSGLLEDAPYFEIKGSKTRGKIGFRGVPGGHEFSSLVLAILHQDGKGKLPDEGIISQTQAIKGPVRLKTYVSLTCENCPEVVQALNLMATIHPDFHHETVDGGIAQKEIESLGIQGVPALIHNGQLIHSGKIDFANLLKKLEDLFGKSSKASKTKDLGKFDVAVIGGGPAGVAAAIYSVRKGLKTAIIAEKFGGQLQETKGIENMISVPYTEGVKLSAQLGEHLSQYPVKLFEHRRVSSIDSRSENLKKVVLESGEFLESPAVIIATGAKWRQLGIPGEKEHIGLGVAFCAHCDGPFYKGKRVVVVGGGNSGVEAAIDLSGIAESVTLLEYGANLKADNVLIEKLKNLSNAKIITQAKSIRVIGDGKKVSGLEYQNLSNNEISTLETDGVFVQIGLLPNSQFVKNDLNLTPHGEIIVDPKGRTSIKGVYAAGDVTTIPFKQIVVAMGDGAKVALTAFEDRLHSKP